MPVNRAAAHHRERVAEALRDEVDTIIEGELRDPRIGLCHVSEVVLAPGGKAARILISVEEEDDAVAEDTIQALMQARAFVRALVRDRLGKRHIPELTFHLDRSLQFNGRIDELLHRVEKRARKKTADPE